MKSMISPEVYTTKHYNMILSVITHKKSLL